jgi:kynurenine formamidase
MTHTAKLFSALIAAVIIFVFINYKKDSSAMTKVIDLTHTFAGTMPIHAYDEPPTLEKIRTLKDDHYNDWRLCSGMHVGTHIDGPGHLTDSPTLLSNIPVDKFIGKGHVIDARNKTIDKSLLNGVTLEPYSIVLICTGTDKKFGTKDYFEHHPILGKDFAEELVRHKVKMVGIDFFSPDNYPFEIHKVFFAHDILIIENLTNLEKLIGVKNFTIAALPLKTQTDSSLARVIAIL